jgi:hypothetical protein
VLEVEEEGAVGLLGDVQEPPVDGEHVLVSPGSMYHG